MTKQKKKRNKVYSGANAAKTRPVVTRIQAANRGKVSQYWFERKKILKPLVTTVLVILGVIVLLVELVRVVSGS
jgi:hypothetical protein